MNQLTVNSAQLKLVVQIFNPAKYYLHINFFNYDGIPKVKGIHGCSRCS
jgi:hypothetical protein